MVMNETLRRARSLRKTMTEPERRLWSRLRGRRFAGFKFRRQVPLGHFIADFVCFDRKLIQELDGGQHTLQREYDAMRTAWLAAQGFRVLRVWNHEPRESADAVDELILRELNRV
jgi:very-short-patch-repair endonuclease